MNRISIENKLYTVEFSSSYEESEDFTPPPSKSPILFNSRTKKITKNPPNLGDLEEISDSYYEYSEAEPSVKNIKQHSNHEIKDIAFNKQEISSSEDDLSYKPIEQNNNKAKNALKKANYTENNNNNKIISLNEQKTDSDSDNVKYRPTLLLKSLPRQSRPICISANNQEEKHTKKTDFPSYLIKREKKSHLNGRHLFFSFYKNSEKIYFAKFHSKSSHQVEIVKGNETHKRIETDAVILVGNEGSDFSLRMNERLGEEVLTIRFLPPKTSANKTRRMSVIFFDQTRGNPKIIFSKNPVVNPDGKVEHDFEGRFAVNSIKNAVLVSKIEGINLMYIRKIGNNEIEIEPRFNHDDLWIFAIGIASFLSKVKGAK